MRIGVDIGGTNIKIGLFEEDGSIVEFTEKKVSELTGDDLYDKLISILKEVISDSEIEKGGLAIKGLVDKVKGSVIEDIGLAGELAGRSLSSLLLQELNIPFSIDNDARAYTLGEWKFGAGKNYDSIVVFTLGTGVGCSVILNGKVSVSSDPLSGVLGGHISIDRNGPECACGNKGCLELYCSATAFTKMVREKHPELSESDDVLKVFFNKLHELNEYESTLKIYQENLAIGIVNAIHAYGPQAVIIGGGVMNSSEHILPYVQEIVNKRAWTIPRGKVKILPGELGNKAAALGAAFNE